MQNIKTYISSLLLLFVGLSLAQESNEFLSRAYWKTNPSIADIEKKIAEGNDIAELDRHMFDAVSISKKQKIKPLNIYFLKKEMTLIN